MIYVFFHNDCPDGMMAAATIEYRKDKLFEDISKYGGLQYIGWSHSKSNLDKIELIKPTDYVIFLDISPSLDILQNYLQNNKILIIDHHKNPIEQIADYCDNNHNITLYYENTFTKAASLLCWEYFNEPDTLPPAPLKYIADMDVWNFSDEYTEPFNIAFKKIFNFENIPTATGKVLLMRFVMFLNYDMVQYIVNMGIDIIKQYKTATPAIFTDTENITLYDEEDKEYSVLSVECKNYEMYKYIIEYAREHYKEYPILRISRKYEDTINYSLRTIDDTMNVDSIARKYGGNGHMKASGYVVKINNV